MTAKVRWLGDPSPYAKNEMPPTTTESQGLHFEKGKWVDVPDASMSDLQRLAKFRGNPQFEVEGDKVNADAVKATAEAIKAADEVKAAEAKANAAKAVADAKAAEAKVAGPAKGK